MIDLYSRLAYIGIRVPSGMDSGEFIDIEKTIIDALYEVDTDSRLLSLIFSWIEIHGLHLIADKFIKYYLLCVSIRGECPWVVAVGAKLVDMKDHRFKKLIKKFDKEIWIGDIPQKTALKMDGAIKYLQECNIQIPQKFIRIREKDIFSKKELINSNLQYANRYRFGTNWRSEIITAIQRGIDNPYKISKELNIAYSRVSIVFNEYILL